MNSAADLDIVDAIISWAAHRLTIDDVNHIYAETRDYDPSLVDQEALIARLSLSHAHGDFPSNMGGLEMEQLAGYVWQPLETRTFGSPVERRLWLMSGLLRSAFKVEFALTEAYLTIADRMSRSVNDHFVDRILAVVLAGVIGHIAKGETASNHDSQMLRTLQALLDARSLLRLVAESSTAEPSNVGHQQAKDDPLRQWRVELRECIRQIAMALDDE